jgi:transposase
MRRLVSKGETSGMNKKHGLKKQSKKVPATPESRTVGIDLGDQWSRYCVLDGEGEVIEEGRFKTAPGALTKHFADSERMRIALEAGTHSLWVSEHLRQLGHEVLVANARRSGRLRTATARAISSTPKSWLVMRESIRRSCTRLHIVV